MLHNQILPGEENTNAMAQEYHWKNDAFPELHNNDALWVFMIHCSKENHCQVGGQVKDAVIQHLLVMGTYDWEKLNNQLNQTTPAMQFTTALGSHLVDCIIKIKDRVRGLLMFLLLKLKESLIG